MSGAIRPLPSGRLQLRVYIGTDPATGRQLVRTRTIPKQSKRAAGQELARFVAELDPVRQNADKLAERTMTDLLRRWLQIKHPNVAPGTYADYHRIAGQIIESMGDRPAHTVTTADLDRYYANLGATLGPARIRRYHNVLSGAFRQAVKWGWIAASPTVNATPPTVPRTEASAPSPEQLAAIIDAADDDLTAWLVLAASTGLRPGELAALRWDDFDLADAEMVVKRAIGPAAKGHVGPGGLSGLVLKDTKTHRARPLSLDPDTVLILEDHRLRALLRASSIGADITSGYVFTYDPAAAVPWRPDSVAARFRRVCKKIGVEGVKPYGTRHFAATQLLAAGVNVRIVAHRLGHARTSTTTDIYAHVVKSDDAAAAAALGQIVHRRNS